MRTRELAHAAARWTAVGTAAAVTLYAAYVSVAWFRYGRVLSPRSEKRDALLDGFMPTYEITEHHDIRVAAPADMTLAVARNLDVLDLPVVRALVKGRELIIGATPDTHPRPHALIAEMQSIGWGMLAEIPDGEIVMGAVTRPWDANVVFRAVPPEEFSAFHEPGYVKIIWTLRADQVDADHSIFSTETRAIATDPIARSKFRTYWSFLSPGIILIRMAAVRAVRAEAERQVREVAAAPQGGRV
jgi:hypothetical protein